MGRRKGGSPVHGWLVLDKPFGMSSSRAVGAVRNLLGAAKAGHGGTLDPLATGILPIALGEATKTVAWAMAGRKTYRFTLRWGEARATDDAEGEVTATSDMRPDAAAVAAILPRFTGSILQVPPAYSALKLAGERAYDLARRGETVELAARDAEIFALRLLRVIDADHAELEVETGKGVYVRSLGRDIARALGTVAHIAALRRLAVGSFTLERAISLDKLEALRHSAAVFEHLLPIETALDDIPAMALTEAEAHRLRHGQTVVPLLAVDQARLDELGNGAVVRATTGETLVALTEISAGGLRPVRVLNL
ncbi:MAG: tRNA pseudouridine(55) synthase TruB [Rhodospirillales bacterium]|jgi:tRNA pseudouridine55 synthase|nr:tRNA pseudouridine(55) synthase TruB [Rhodospirillales bacterium]